MQQVRWADGKSVRVRYGEFSVPESRTARAEGEICIRWMRLYTAASEPATPLIYCGEGPGVPSVVDVDADEMAAVATKLERWRPFLVHRDVVLFDHRGCGRSERDLKWRPASLPPEMFFADADVALGYLLEESRHARAELLSQGAQLDGYQALDAAHDVDAICDELQLDALVLLGYSYGAQQLMSYLRVGERVPRAAVLVGTEGCGDAFKLPLQTDRYFESQRLLDPFLKAAERIERERPRLAMHHRRLDRRFELEVGRFGLALAVCRRLYAEGTLSQLRPLFDALAAGEFGQLEGWLRRLLPLALRIDGMPYLVDGASGASAARLAQIDAEAARSAFGNAMNFPFPQIGEAWRPRDLGDGYREDPTPEIPLLFVAGELDWNTPPAQAERIASKLSDASLEIVSGAVHETLMRDSTTLQRMATFLMERADRGS